MDDRATLCNRTIEAIRAVPADHRPPVVIGFDGFVDRICDVVDRRHDADRYDRIRGIEALGGRISAAAGQSANIEVVVKQVKIGGNGPIMAKAMLGYGTAVTYVGNIGADEGGDAVDPVFVDLAAGAERIVNLGTPAATDALEFSDGKIMLTKSTPLNQITLERIQERVADLAALLAGARAVATVNWTQVVALTAIWEAFVDDILPAGLDPRPLFFVDLADPAKRSQEDLAAALRTLQRLQDKVDVVLGMNGSEGRQVVEALGGAWQGDKEDTAAAERCAAEVRERLGISWAMVHLVGSAACAWDGGSIGAPGFLCEDPAITTGAGDHFNAGFIAGLVAGMAPEVALTLGGATSGAYVRSAESPDWATTVAFLEHAAAEATTDA